MKPHERRGKRGEKGFKRMNLTTTEEETGIRVAFKSWNEMKEKR